MQPALKHPCGVMGSTHSGMHSLQCFICYQLHLREQQTICEGWEPRTLEWCLVCCHYEWPRTLHRGDFFNYELSPVSNDCNTTIIENYSYQSVMEAFEPIMVGSIENLLDEQNLLTIELNTTVMITSLSDTKELSFLTQGQTDYNLNIFRQVWDGNSVI